ncbi:flagellin N-terminal helical domain-containing protein [Priestia aryabhattai]
MRINHNIAALNTYRQFNNASNAQSKSMEKLSSGLRINSAADDAAGLAISEKMRAQVRGLDQASANAQDGISLIQTAEGALSETQDILQRMRELATQSANDTNTTDDRGEIQKEMNQLTSEINRIGNTTEFNTKKLLNGKVNVTEAVSANVKGNSVGNSIEIVASATKGAATGAAITGTKEIHAGKGASISGDTGAPALDDATLAGTNLAIDNSHNELTLSVNGTQKTIALAVATYDGNSGTNTAQADFLADLQTKLDTAFGTNKVLASVDATTNKLTLTENGTKDSTTSIKVDGGNAAETLFGTNWATTGVKTTAGEDANNKLTVSVNGVSKELTLSAASYDTANPGDRTSLVDDINTQLDAAFGAGNAIASFDATAGNKLVITSQSTGSTSTVSGISGTAASDLGLTSATSATGKDQNNQVSMTVDGEVVTATLAAGTYDSNVLASTLQSEINADTTVDAKVSFEDGKFTITSGKEGSTGSVSITDNGLAKSIGLSTGSTATSGVDAKNEALKFQTGANAGQSMSVDIADMRAAALEISSTSGNTKSVVDGQGNTLTASYKTTDDVTNGTDSTGAEKALDLSTADKATAAVAVLDEALAKVSGERSKLGAFQNRLDHTINNLSTSSQNLTSAESRIRDVDYALAA